MDVFPKGNHHSAEATSPDARVSGPTPADLLTHPSLAAAAHENKDNLSDEDSLQASAERPKSQQKTGRPDAAPLDGRKKRRPYFLSPHFTAARKEPAKRDLPQAGAALHGGRPAPSDPRPRDWNRLNALSDSSSVSPTRDETEIARLAIEIMGEKKSIQFLRRLGMPV